MNKIMIKEKEIIEQLEKATKTAQEQIVKDFLLTYFENVKKESWSLLMKLEKTIDNLIYLLKKAGALDESIEDDDVSFTHNIDRTGNALSALLNRVEHELNKNLSLIKYDFWKGKNIIR